MKVRHCLIVEDSEASVDLLKSYIDKLPFFKTISVAENYSDAIEILLNTKIDLIFLDIELNSKEKIILSGLDILKTFEPLPPVIIISSYNHYAIESYNIGKTTDYILKPFDFNRFLLAVNRALKVNFNTSLFFDNDYIFLKMGRKYQKFIIAEIDYFEAYGIYLKIFINGTHYVVNETISAINERLDSSKFIRIHKSYIINIEKINGFDHRNIFLKTYKIPIGISYKPQLSPLLRLFEKID